MRLAFESFSVQVPLTLPANFVTKPLVTVNERSEQTGCIAALFVNNPFPFAVAVSSVSLAADNATTAFASFRPESSVPVVVERFSSQRFALTMRACPNAISLGGCDGLPILQRKEVALWSNFVDGAGQVSVEIEI